MTDDRGHRPRWCIHYRGIRGPRGEEVTSCKKGVEYSSFKNAEGKRLMAEQPCFLDENGNSQPGALPCEHLRRPTPDEIAQNRKWFKARMERLGAVMTAIRPWRDKNKGKSASEVVACPACSGRLHLSIAAYNGHVRGQCETKNCVSWME